MFDARDFRDFYEAMSDGELALTGVLGNRLSESDTDEVSAALDKLTEARKLVSGVHDRLLARNASSR